MEHHLAAAVTAAGAPSWDREATHRHVVVVDIVRIMRLAAGVDPVLHLQAGPRVSGTQSSPLSFHRLCERQWKGVEGE